MDILTSPGKSPAMIVVSMAIPIRYGPARANRELRAVRNAMTTRWIL